MKLAKPLISWLKQLQFISHKNILVKKNIRLQKSVIDQSEASIPKLCVMSYFITSRFMLMHKKQ